MNKIKLLNKFWVWVFVLMQGVVSSSAGAEEKVDNTDGQSEIHKISSNSGTEEKTLPSVYEDDDNLRVVTLEEVLRLAEQRNLSLAQGKNELVQAQARLSQSYTGIMPNASASLNYIFLDHEDAIDPAQMLGAPGGSVDMDPIIVRRRHDVNGSISIRVPLVNVAAWSGIKTAKTAVKLSELTYDQMKSAILFGTAKAYYVALMSASMVSLQEEQIISAEHHFEVASQKEAAGTGLRIDVLRAQTELEQAKQDLEDAKLSLDNACDALGVLTGLGGLPRPAFSQKIASLEINPQQQEMQALQNRGELSILRKSQELSNEQFKGAKYSFLPMLNATWQGTQQITETGAFGDPDKTRWMLMFNLTVPLFDWGTISSHKVQRAAIEQISLQVAEKEQSIQHEVRQAIREYKSAIRANKNATMQSSLAQEALIIATAAYEAGAGTSLDVTDARRTTSATRVNELVTQLNAKLSLIKLFETMGENPFQALLSK